MEPTTLTINIGLLNGVLALVVFVFGIGAAYATIFSKLSGLQESVGGIGKTLAAVKHNVGAIAMAVARSPHVDFDGTLVQAMSPLRITTEGQTKLDAIGFTAVYEANKGRFLAAIGDDAPRTKYDVEVSAQKCVLLLLTEPMFDGIKGYLYQNPKEDMSVVVSVGGLYVRDRYLEAHPEIIA